LRLLFLNRCYYPDIEATGQLLGELCSDLARRHDVTVIAGQPNFVGAAPMTAWLRRERHHGVTVVRTRNFRFTKASFVGRVVGLFSYVLLALWAALWQRRPQVIIVETDPPVLGALGAFLKWWHRCPLIYYLQDLFPEVGLALGKLRPGPLSTFLRSTTQIGLVQADRVVVLGEDMRGRVLARNIDPAKVAIVPNWADASVSLPDHDSNALRKQWSLDGRFAVMYSGNLGLSQGLETVLEAARRLQTEPALFLFVGEGAAKAGLMARANDWQLANVRFYPYQPKDRLLESLSAADLHLIPLRRGLAGTIVPSKIYGILAAGVAYIAAVDADSEVARIARESATGMLIEPDAVEQLVEAIRWAMSHRDELAAMGRRGRELAQTEYDRKLAVSRFEEVLDAAIAPIAAQPACRLAAR
jgi:putative colanic acid biosynthesis glycosyltransferase WcaI